MYKRIGNIIVGKCTVSLVCIARCEGTHVGIYTYISDASESLCVLGWRLDDPDASYKSFFKLVSWHYSYIYIKINVRCV